MVLSVSAQKVTAVFILCTFKLSKENLKSKWTWKFIVEASEASVASQTGTLSTGAGASSSSHQQQQQPQQQQHTHFTRCVLSASPASEFGAGSVSIGNISSRPATVVEIWLAEPYQAKNIILLCAGNHSLFMRRRLPDTVEIQQMRAQERDERTRREASYIRV